MFPVDRRLVYQGLKNDCFGHGLWIHDRIYRNPAPIDVAFLGSSHTINGINDRLIDEIVPPAQVVNLGYCRFGRNFSYALLKELVDQREVKQVILEVREGEDRYSHPIFPYIARSKDVVLPNLIFNRDVLSDIWSHFAYKIELLQDELYDQQKPVLTQQDNYGFTTSSDTASSRRLEEIEQMRSLQRPRASGIGQAFYDHYASIYLKKIGRICLKHGIRISFIYLPSFGSPYRQPSLGDLYSKYGNLWIPPKHILDNKNHWYDENHLNQTGARALSTWIAEQLPDD